MSKEISESQAIEALQHMDNMLKALGIQSLLKTFDDLYVGLPEAERELATKAMYKQFATILKDNAAGLEKTASIIKQSPAMYANKLMEAANAIPKDESKLS